jgi:hypothetical protein
MGKTYSEPNEKPPEPIFKEPGDTPESSESAPESGEPVKKPAPRKRAAKKAVPPKDTKRETPEKAVSPVSESPKETIKKDSHLTIRPNPVAWETALGIAGGDKSRLRIITPTEIVITNYSDRK